MKVPHDEGLAAHIGPESCVYARKGISEALTGGMRAGLLSCESFKIQFTSFSCGNREVPRLAFGDAQGSAL
jgi:hypothetical protein